MQKRIPVTATLKNVIEFVNIELQRKQAELLQIVTESSLEQMKLLGISTETGWRLDYENMEYVKLEEEQPQQEEVVDASE
jgi:hypothetical protein